MVMNEPQARTASYSENQFILNVIAAARDVTDKPISVRFMGGYSPSTGHYSRAIDDASDFLCRNTYWDPRAPSRSVYGCSERSLLDARDRAHAQGKPLWITEFGKTKSNHEAQRSYVEAFVTWARSNDIDAVFCWVSQPDVSGESYNIFTGYTPHPAFYELGGGEAAPEPPPTQPPEEPPEEPPPEEPEPPPPSSPPDLFEDSFESGSLNRWAGTGTTYGDDIIVTSSEAYRGSYSVRCTKTGPPSDYRENAYVYRSIGEVTEAYANLRVRIDSAPTPEILIDEGDIVYFIRFSDGEQALAQAGMRRDGGIVEWLLYAGGTYVTAPIAVTTDRWYSIELHWNAADGLAELFYEGQEILQLQVGWRDRINANFVDIGLIAARGVQNELTIYCDCFRLSTKYIGPEISGTYPPWDINQDGVVGLLDINIFNNAYGTTPYSRNWNPDADFNSDRRIDLDDLHIIVTHYGERYT
jgi:hypothetical protein